MIKILKQNGSILIAVIVLTGMFLVVLFGAITSANLEQKLIRQKIIQAQAFHIAEAGLEIAKAQLAKNPADYNASGLRPLESQDGQASGYYEFFINPSGFKNSIAQIKSIGFSNKNPNFKKVLTEELRPKTWANYFIINENNLDLPGVDFDSLSGYADSLIEEAKANGIFLADSKKRGYHIILKPDNTFDLYIVKLLNKRCISEETYSIREEDLVSKNNPFPKNGLIFSQDNIWVEGRIDQARLTIFAFEPKDHGNHESDIIINNNLIYSNYDGQDAIGLVSEGNIFSLYSGSDNLRIDAAMIAQNGRLGVRDYSEECHQFEREHEEGSNEEDKDFLNNIEVYGTLASRAPHNFRSTFFGFYNEKLEYDQKLAVNPPPYFPPLEGESLVFWKED